MTQWDRTWPATLLLTLATLRPTAPPGAVLDLVGRVERPFAETSPG